MEIPKKIVKTLMFFLVLFQLFPTLIFIPIVSNPLKPMHGSLFLQQIPLIDGKITKGEYSNSYIDPNDEFKLYWKINEDIIYLAMVGNTTGWVGIGFDPGFIVKDADMIIGWVNSSGAYAFDAYATEVVGGFKLDTALGGANNLLAWNGTQTNTQTIIEFSRPLETNDRYDKIIVPDKNTTIIWAIGSANQDNMNTKPADFGQTLIEFGKVNVTITKDGTSFSNKWIIIGSIFSIIILGVIIYYYITTIFLKNRKNKKAT